MGLRAITWSSEARPEAEIVRDSYICPHRPDGYFLRINLWEVEVLFSATFLKILLRKLPLFLKKAGGVPSEDKSSGK